MKLYDYPRSSAAYRVRIALNLKGLAYDSTVINLVEAEQRSDDYLAVNPQGLVPALSDDTGDTFTQSLAILEWLEERYPEPPLLPVDAAARARVRGMMYIIACDMHPLNNLRVLRYLVDDLACSEAQKLAWYHHWLRAGFTALEQQVLAAPFTAGEQVTLADVCLVPQMANARRFELDLAPFPRLVAICSALEALPAFAAAAP